jgi:hypothetical protein
MAGTDLNRPFFCTEGFEDMNESCSQGAYIGGMAAAHKDAGIGTSYMRAAELLVERGLRDDCVHEVVLPALFLYRHALELRLKFAVRPTKLNHDLEALAVELDASLVRARGFGLPARLLARVGEIARFDPRADAFRFTYAAKKRRNGEPHFPEELWIDLSHLRSVMSWLDAELRVAAELVTDTEKRVKVDD